MLTPLGPIALAPIRVNDTSGWSAAALRELGKEWSAAAQFAYIASVDARRQLERGLLCTLIWPG